MQPSRDDRANNEMQYLHNAFQHLSTFKFERCENTDIMSKRNELAYP